MADCTVFRIQRDVAVRGRDIASVIQQYTEQVKPAFDQYVAPSRKHADVIIPWVRYIIILVISPKPMHSGCTHGFAINNVDTCTANALCAHNQLLAEWRAARRMHAGKA